MKKVLPIPVHQDVTELWLADLVKRIGQEKAAT